jgi:hypothetical protein
VKLEALVGGGEGGGGDVADVVTVVYIGSLGGEELGDLEDGGWAASGVPLEIDAGEVTLRKVLIFGLY